MLNLGIDPSTKRNLVIDENNRWVGTLPLKVSDSSVTRPELPISDPRPSESTLDEPSDSMLPGESMLPSESKFDHVESDQSDVAGSTWLEELSRVERNNETRERLLVDVEEQVERKERERFEEQRRVERSARERLEEQRRVKREQRRIERSELERLEDRMKALEREMASIQRTTAFMTRANRNSQQKYALYTAGARRAANSHKHSRNVEHRFKKETN